MDATERRNLHHALDTRRETISACWYRAIAPTALSPLPPADVQLRLLALTDQAIALLVADAFEQEEAVEIGAALARLRYLQPASLGGTQAVLADELVADLPAEQATALRPRLAALLGGIASGYLCQVQETILAEQETIRAALLRQRERLSSTLRESEARFRTIFSNAAIGIVLVDLTGRSIECNRTIERTLGYTRDELRGMVFTAVTHPDDVSADRALFQELIAGRRDTYQIEKRYLHKDGHVVWSNLIVSLVRDERGTPQFTIGMMEDVTEHKRIEDGLTEALRRLAESRETERLRLAQELHDTALQHLLGINLYLTETRKRAGERQAAEIPIESVVEIQRMVQEVTAQLRALLRDMRPPGLEEFGLIIALDGYIAALQRERQEKQPVLIVAMEGNDKKLPLTISLPLFRGVQETLRNALGHAHARRITVSLHIDSVEVMLSVRDDGVGFYVPDPLSVFAFRSHFGLIGIAERVALAGGEFAIHSEPGTGTVVTIRIPVPQEEADDDGTDPHLDR